MVESRSAKEMARDEREEFAALLDGLTPQQWESPTLCELWRVREVAVHTVSYDELSTAGLVRRFLKVGSTPTASMRSASPTTPTGRRSRSPR